MQRPPALFRGEKGGLARQRDGCLPPSLRRRVPTPPGPAGPGRPSPVFLLSARICCSALTLIAQLSAEGGSGGEGLLVRAAKVVT